MIGITIGMDLKKAATEASDRMVLENLLAKVNGIYDVMTMGAALRIYIRRKIQDPKYFEKLECETRKPLWLSQH